METTKVKKFDYKDAKDNISYILLHLSKYIKYMNDTNDIIHEASSNSYINTLLNDLQDIEVWTKVLKYQIKTLSDSIRNK